MVNVSKLVAIESPELIDGLAPYLCSLALQEVDLIAITITNHTGKRGSQVVQQRFNLSLEPISRNQTPQEPYARYLTSLYFEPSDPKCEHPIGIMKYRHPYPTLRDFGLQVATYLAQQEYQTILSLALRPNNPLAEIVATPTPQEAASLPPIDTLLIPYL